MRKLFSFAVLFVALLSTLQVWEPIAKPTSWPASVIIT